MRSYPVIPRQFYLSETNRQLAKEDASTGCLNTGIVVRLFNGDRYIVFPDGSTFRDYSKTVKDQSGVHIQITEAGRLQKTKLLKSLLEKGVSR